VQITVEQNIQADLVKLRKVWDTPEPDRIWTGWRNYYSRSRLWSRDIKVFWHWEYVVEFHSCFVCLATDRFPVQSVFTCI